MHHQALYNRREATNPLAPCTRGPMKTKILIPVLLLTLALTGCGPSDDATPAPEGDQPAGGSPPLATTEPSQDVTPLEWLAQMPFEPGSEDQPDILPADLPEGFDAFEPEHGSAETPDGFIVYRSSVTFERTLGGQVSVELSSYDVPEGRIYHLDRIAEEDYAWEFLELDGHQIARYSNSSLDGRAWISGPFMIAIFSSLETSGIDPWVNAIAGLFLDMFPPGESQPISATESTPDVTPIEWLAQAPFVEGGEGQPDMLPADLPEGFNASDPELQSGELPTGAMIYGAGVYFERPVDGQVLSEDFVTVDLYSYATQEGRADHLNLLSEGQEGGSWEFYELDGNRIVRVSADGGEALIWNSGPYLVVIYNSLDTSGSAPWVDAFASLYLLMFPPS